MENIQELKQENAKLRQALEKLGVNPDNLQASVAEAGEFSNSLSDLAKSASKMRQSFVNMVDRYNKYYKDSPSAPIESLRKNSRQSTAQSIISTASTK